MAEVLTRGGAEAARFPHKEQAKGSSPFPAKYQKVGRPEIQIVRVEGNAFDMAREHYARMGLDFSEDLAYYLRTGFVVSRPTVFAMGKIIKRDGRLGWFLQMVAGNLLELLTCLPYKLDFIAFDRNNEGNMRVIDFDWFIKKVVGRMAVQL